MVLVQQNRPKELQRLLLDRYQMQFEVIAERRARNEHLLITKITHCR